MNMSERGMRMILLIFTICSITLSLLFSFLLYHKLITWYIKYQKYLEEIERSQNFKSNQKDIHPLIQKKAPNFEAISNSSNKKLTLDSIVQDNLILIFMDSSCIYCDNNLELFLNEAHNHPSYNYVVILSEEETSKAEIISSLFEIEVLLVKEQVFFDYKIAFWPAFVHLDRNSVIRNITPIPIFLSFGSKTA